MKAWPMRGLLPSLGEERIGLRRRSPAPVSAAQISSNMSASIAPFAPPIGNRLPCSIASFGSVVGLPWRSSAQPSGMRSPRFMAIMILPRTTVVRARSITRVGFFSLWKRSRHGVGAEQRLLAAPGRDRRGRVGEGEARPCPASATGSRWMPEHADVRAVADAGEGDAVAPRALDRPPRPPTAPRHTAGRRGCRSGRRRARSATHRRLRGAVGAAVAQHAAVERDARHAVGRQALLLGVHQVARRGLGHVGIGARPAPARRAPGETVPAPSFFTGRF